MMIVILVVVVVVIWMVVMEVVVKEADEVTKEGIMYNFISCNFGAIYHVFLTQFTCSTINNMSIFVSLQQ